MSLERTKAVWRKATKKYTAKNKAKMESPDYQTLRRGWEKDYRDRKRTEINAKLGNQCARCGFTNPLALCIDHVNGGGVAERTSMSQKTFLNKVLNDTTGMYQLLCANCNLIKRHERDEFWRKYPCGT